MADDDWTDAQLRLEVAKELRVVQQNATALRADWDTYLVNKSRQVRATLTQLELCFWTADAIPAAVQIGLTWLVAEASKSNWGRDSYNKGQGGMQLIQEMAAQAPRNEPTKSVSF